MWVFTNKSQDVDQKRNAKKMHKKAPKYLLNLNNTAFLNFYSHKYKYMGRFVIHHVAH